MEDTLTIQDKPDYEALFRNTTMGIILIGRSGQIELLNPYAESLFGYDSGELPGQFIEKLIPANMQTRSARYREVLFNRPGTRLAGETFSYYCITKIGIVFPVALTLAHFFHYDKAMVVMFVNKLSMGPMEKEALRLHTQSREISPGYSFPGTDGGSVNFPKTPAVYTETEEQLRKLNEALEEKVLRCTAELADALAETNKINTMINDFVALASHEFRTPLSAILSSASLAEKYADTGQQEKKEKHFQRIKTSVMHLVNILDEFLSLEELEQGRIRPEKQIFSLKDYIRNCIIEFGVLLKKGQRIDYEYSGETDVLLDQKILKKILNNLLSNAVKYSDNNIGLRVNVKGQNITLEVEDKGIGILPEDQQYLFEKFYRGKNAAYIQGAGLGLNIVKNYVSLMGGTIGFSSEQGKGTIFTVCLFSFHGGRQLLLEEQPGN